MIAVDSSALIAFIAGASGTDTDTLRSHLPAGHLAVPPVVVSEMLSEPKITEEIRATILGLPVLEVVDGYWVRAGEMRCRLLAMRLRARLPDALIAQSCLDHDVALITRDRDFRHFAEHCGLRLA